MKKNVGTFDAMMRITWGLVGLGWGISRMVHFPQKGFPVFVSMMSAMKVAEGVTRWCPMLEVFGLSTVEKKSMEMHPHQETDIAMVDQHGREFESTMANPS